MVYAPFIYGIDIQRCVHDAFGQPRRNNPTGCSKRLCLTQPAPGAPRRAPSRGKAAGVRDARNNERHVCGRRRDGEPAGSCVATRAYRGPVALHDATGGRYV